MFVREIVRFGNKNDILHNIERNCVYRIYINNSYTCLYFMFLVIFYWYFVQNKNLPTTLHKHVKFYLVHRRYIFTALGGRCISTMGNTSTETYFFFSCFTSFHIAASHDNSSISVSQVFCRFKSNARVCSSNENSLVIQLYITGHPSICCWFFVLIV